MKFLDHSRAEAEMFDSQEYWWSHELRALEEEAALSLSLLPIKAEEHLQALRDSRQKLNEQMKFHPRFDLAEALQFIEAEIKQNYPWHGSQQGQGKSKPAVEDPDLLYSPFPHLRFLLQKRAYLLQKQAKEESLRSAREKGVPRSRRKTPRVALTTGKRMVNAFYNFWARYQNTTWGKSTQSVIQAMMGLVGILDNLVKGIQGLKGAYEAYRQEKIPQRKTRIMTNALMFAMGGAGAGVSFAFLGDLAGIALYSGFMLVTPFVLSALCVGIYAMGLWRDAYILSQLKMAEGRVRELYDETALLEGNDRYELHLLEKKIKVMDIQPVLEKLSLKQALTPQEETLNKEYKRSMERLIKKEADYAQYRVALEKRKDEIEHCREEVFVAERAVAFHSLQVSGATFAMVAVILGATAIIGGSVASFGALPVVLLFVGVAIGVAALWLDHLDQKKDFAYTRGLRDFFVDFRRGGKKLENHEKPKHFRHRVYGRLSLETPKVPETSLTIDTPADPKEARPAEPPVKKGRTPKHFTFIQTGEEASKAERDVPDRDDLLSPKQTTK